MQLSPTDLPEPVVPAYPHGTPPPPGLRDRLAPYGILVRDCASFGLPDHARIAVPGDAGLARLEEVLCAAG